jgi:hypothetical protein
MYLSLRQHGLNLLKYSYTFMPFIDFVIKLAVNQSVNILLAINAEDKFV